MPDTKLQQDRDLLAAAESKGAAAKFAAYFKLSGPGWLQSAITLGGGSLAGSLYIGVIGGYKMLWLQPVMMILGIVMLSAIAYVTLSTGEKPFRSINKHINPVLGWGWLFAAMIANLVWAMPQFSLGTAAMQQNLGLPLGDWGCVAIIFVIASVVIWFYDAGGWGIKLFEIVLKVMVGLIVLAFFGVVAALAFKGALPWAEVFGGFVPDFSLLSQPAESLRPFIAASSDPAYWDSKIVGIQRNTMIAAAATRTKAARMRSGAIDRAGDASPWGSKLPPGAPATAGSGAFRQKASAKMRALATVIRKPVKRITAPSQGSPAWKAPRTRTTFGQKPEKGGRPETAKRKTSISAARAGLPRHRPPMSRSEDEPAMRAAVPAARYSAVITTIE